MSDIMITVQDCRPPNPGKKMGVIKDISGKTWLVDAAVINDFQPGTGINIQQYDTFRTNDGKTLYTIKRYQIVVGGAQTGVRQPPGQQQQYPQRTAPTPQVNDNERRMDIFICGAFNNMLSNPNINPNDLQMMDIIDILQKLKGAWLGVFGPSPLPQRGTQRQDPISSGGTGSLPHNDMNDDIPFGPEMR